ncbi:hypothetical protein BJV82DRAFT_317575 [Fennellomyces sp. T-0311]|nr:hypothetical protein BJV82DRAFT_317575 [Fennellomyces sp. T-0311]
MSRCTNLTIRLISQNQEQALSICTASSKGQEASNEPSRLKSKDAAKKKKKKANTLKQRVELQSWNLIIQHSKSNPSPHPSTKPTNPNFTSSCPGTSNSNNRQGKLQTKTRSIIPSSCFCTAIFLDKRQHPADKHHNNKKKNRCIHCIFAHICIVLANAYCPSLLSFHPIILPAPLCLSRNKSLRTNEYPL